MHKKYKNRQVQMYKYTKQAKIQNTKKLHKAQKVQSTKKSLGRYLLVQKRK